MSRVIIQDWRGDVITSVDEPETQPLELPDELRYNHHLIDDLRYAYQRAARLLGPDSKIDIVLRLTYHAYPNRKKCDGEVLSQNDRIGEVALGE